MIRITKLILAAASCLLMTSMTATAQPAQLHFCDNGRQTWTTYDASYDGQPGFFHQEMGVGDAGSYTVTAVANGFTFDGYSYARDDARDEYVRHRQAKGVRSFSTTYNVGDWGGLFLFQLVKNGSGCRNCTVTMTLQPKNCKKKEDSGGGICSPNYCYREGQFGLPGTCEYSPGASGHDVCH